MVEARPQRFVFAAVALAAALAGTGLWLATAPPPRVAAPDIAPSAVFAAGFTDLQGASRSLGQFEGRILVVNFWATWCAPCREEMPAFSRLQTVWASRGVQFVGLASEEPRRVAAFIQGLGVTYPVWVGGEDVAELSRRLGNTTGALPHTVVFDASGHVIASKVGAYSEAALNAVLENAATRKPAISSNSG